MVASQAPLLCLLLLPVLLLAGCTDDASPRADATPAAEEPQDVAPVAGAVAPPPEPEVIPAWPDLAQARIRPGVAIQGTGPSLDEPMPSGGCTSNFVFFDGRDGRIFLGTAAHCFQSGEYSPVGVDGECSTSLAIGTLVQVDGAMEPTTLAYSSYHAMQDAKQREGVVCADNDFALLEIAATDVPYVHPAVLHFGGPVALSDGKDLTDTVAVSYGNSGNRPVDSELDPAAGRIFEANEGGWNYMIDFQTRRIPGDSGSAVLTDDGLALGVVRTINGGGHNDVSDLRHLLDYARQATGWDLRLATWDQFSSETLLPP